MEIYRLLIMEKGIKRGHFLVFSYAVIVYFIAFSVAIALDTVHVPSRVCSTSPTDPCRELLLSALFSSPWHQCMLFLRL